MSYLSALKEAGKSILWKATAPVIVGGFAAAWYNGGLLWALFVCASCVLITLFYYAYIIYLSDE